MTFIGRLKQHCEIWRRWNGERRVGGELCGVHFSWEPGNVYRTAALSDEQIGLLRGHGSIIFEAFGMELSAPPAAVAAVEGNLAKSARPVVLGDKPPWQKPARRA